MQTQSLRLEAVNGHQYVLRSIQKNPRKAIPKILRSTLAAEVVQDAISAAHPYASLTVPPLADAAGVYHTNPKLFYVPKDDILGEYKDEFGETITGYEMEKVPTEEYKNVFFRNFVSVKEMIEMSKGFDKIVKDDSIDTNFQESLFEETESCEVFSNCGE